MIYHAKRSNGMFMFLNDRELEGFLTKLRREPRGLEVLRAGQEYTTGDMTITPLAGDQAIVPHEALSALRAAAFGALEVVAVGSATYKALQQGLVATGDAILIESE